MQKYLKGILAFAFILLFLSGLSAQGLSPAADFTLSDLEGNKVTLGDYKDKKPVVLLFWTTWCYYCRNELRETGKDYPLILKDGVELLAINGGESSEKVKRYLKDFNLNIKVLLDADDRVSRLFSVLGVPTYIFIDKKGNIIFHDHYFSREKYDELISK